MDAVRLIETTRQALARSSGLSEIVAEACQAQALAEAVGTWLAVSGPPGVRAEAIGLSEAGRTGRSAMRHRGRHADGIRAARLSVIQDAHAVLLALSGLLADAAAALVGVAVRAEEEGLYWQCIEAIDAADESGDQAAGVLRCLALPERGAVG
ncbi:DUF6099 family protein [Streptomyces oceani]|uniref:Uncharacterized protein n=1 Tax=Streptomyces oceani TaxID=1075402 RepID=A0A1E7KKK5_9ACTN|nr:DUF6099 family protein [Streptomyces oceani]OEV04529.1 hypothetical protein AN216_06335 [Streptomyces oceani]